MYFVMLIRFNCSNASLDANEHSSIFNITRQVEHNVYFRLALIDIGRLIVNPHSVKHFSLQLEQMFFFHSKPATYPCFSSKQHTAPSTNWKPRLWTISYNGGVVILPCKGQTREWSPPRKIWLLVNEVCANAHSFYFELASVGSK